MEDRAPVPWSEAAEVAVLGAMLMDEEARRVAEERLEVDDFHREANRRIFRAAARLNGRGGELDVVTLSDELRSAGELDAAGGHEYLARLVDAVPTAAGVERHAEIVRDKATLRRLIEAARQVDQDARASGAGEAPDAVARARERLREIEERAGGLDDGEEWDLADVMADPAGLRMPDELLSGIALPEHFVLYCGDPKVGGKTSFLAAGAGAVATGGRFLGRRVRQGTVLWVMGEGSQKHIGRYLAQVGLTPPRERFVAVRSSADPIGQLERKVERHEPDLVVVDTLGSWTAPLDVDHHTPEVAHPLKRVEAVARSGPAVVMIHWGRKADGDPAGHHTIKAIPDAIRMVEEGEIDRERVVRGHGRWHLPTIRYRMEEVGPHPEVSDLRRVRFRRVDLDRALDERILDFLEANPGASKSAILEGVGGARRAKKVEALDGLKRAGLVVADTSGRAHTHRIAENPRGHGTATVSDGSGHDGAGTGGVTVAAGDPPSPKGGGPSATVAEPAETDVEPKRCACGNRIGPTAMTCGRCRGRRRRTLDLLPDPDDVVTVGDPHPTSPRRTA